MDKNEATRHDDDGWKNHDGKSFPPDNYDATHVKMRNGEAIPRALSSSLGVMLAKQAGLDRDRTLRPFAAAGEIAEKAWDSAQ